MITERQKRAFFEEGYLHVANAVPQALVDAARAAIDESVERYGLHAPDPSRGDLIIAHHLLVHDGTCNTSENTRYAVIARLRHVDCDANGADGYVDIWREWEGLRATRRRTNERAIRRILGQRHAVYM